jgi:hypothetical protein
VDTSRENELAALAADLERYWSDQWRRAKEICDLLERRLAGGTSTGPQLRLVSSPRTTPEPGQIERSQPPLKLVDA